MSVSYNVTYVRKYNTQSTKTWEAEVSAFCYIIDVIDTLVATSWVRTELILDLANKSYIKSCNHK